LFEIPVRNLKNKPENALFELASNNGWITTKRGWPDFMAFSIETGEMICVECKPRLPSGRLQLLKREQAKCMDYLESKGIRCFVSDGIKLERYKPEVHASEIQRRKSRAERSLRNRANR
jgi:hypothetical protein